MNKVLVFDLDDTLYKEIEFVSSAFNYITEFLWLRNRIDISSLAKDLIKDKRITLYDEMMLKFDISPQDFALEKYLELYRFHYPKLNVNKNLIELLKNLKKDGFKTGLITDGRYVTQRNKLNSLQIINFFDTIIISEQTGISKPHPHNYKLIESKFIESDVFYYIGDNTDKDFIYPSKNKKWLSICVLDNGLNIHKQDSKFIFDNHIETISEITKLKEAL